METKQAIGIFLGVFVVIVVGLALFQSSAQQVGSATNTIAVVNQSETLAANGQSIYIEEYKALSGVVILNASDDVTIDAGNYTVTNNVINPTTGELSVEITTDDAEFASNAVKVSGTAQPLGYISDSSGRSIATLIVLLTALAIGMIALIPATRNGILSYFK